MFVIAAHRARSQGLFEDTALANMRRISAHLPTILRVQNQFSQQQTEADKTIAALDRLPHAVMILDRQGRIRYANRSADQLLAQGNGLTAKQCLLTLNNLSDNMNFQHQLKEICQIPPRPQSSLICLRDMSGKPQLQLTLAPLAPHTGLCLSWQQPMAMLIVQPAFQKPCFDGFASAPYGLTKAEIALVQALIAGSTPEEYAEMKGVSTNTVRTQVRSILEKTGTRRIVEAVTLLASIVVV